MNPRSRMLRGVLIGSTVVLLVLGAMGGFQFQRFGEFSRSQEVKGYWASLQDFVRKNGHFPKNTAEIAAFFHETPEQIGNEPVEYVAPHSTNADEVILWHRKKTLFGVRIGITRSGEVIRR